jgi:hypothetical protein
MIVAVEQNTAEEVIRAGRELLAMCADIPTEHAPTGFRNAAIDLKVMLTELAEQATDDLTEGN